MWFCQRKEDNKKFAQTAVNNISLPQLSIIIATGHPYAEPFATPAKRGVFKVDWTGLASGKKNVSLSTLMERKECSRRRTRHDISSCRFR